MSAFVCVEIMGLLLKGVICCSVALLAIFMLGLRAYRAEIKAYLTYSRLVVYDAQGGRWQNRKFGESSFYCREGEKTSFTNTYVSTYCD